MKSEFAYSPPEDWSDTIRPQGSTVESDADTERFYIPTDLEAIAYTVEPREAIECFQNRYPREAIVAGMANPEDATAMLVEICDKYGDMMTAEQQAFVKYRAAETVHQIVEAVDIEEVKEPGEPDSDETPTIPMLPTLYRMVDVVDLLDDDAIPDIVAATAESDLKKAVDAVKKHGDVSSVRNIEAALKYYDSPDNVDHLGTLVATIEVQDASRAQEELEIKIDNDPDKFSQLSGPSSSEESQAEKLVDAA
jgi:hypothetical protein